MAAHFVNIDRNTPMLLPVDMRDWIAGDDMAHFILEAVELVDLAKFRINERGCGSEQFPPRMMLALLIYCYSHGIFGSRRIEAATHHHLSVRYLTGNTHPDHDTICKFRRENFDAIAGCFLRVLELAKELGLLRLGTVAIDGTRLQANASKHRNVGYERAGELIEQLKLDIAELMQKAEAADTTPAQQETLPAELARRQALLEKLTAAREAIEQRAKEQAQKQMPAYEQKVKAQAERRHGGRVAKPPTTEPEPDEQINLTDPESRLMRKSRNEAYQQSYNAQAAVTADGSQLIVGARVSDNASDKGQLEPTLAAIPAELGTPAATLTDNGFLNTDAIGRVMERGIDVYCACAAEAALAQRRYDFRPPAQRSESPRPVTDPRLIAMQEKLATPEGRALYGRRKTSVEPVFGIIKHVLGFRQFLLRGLEKVSGEWQLVALAYNCKRLCRLRTIAAA
jgi:transposase